MISTVQVAAAVLPLVVFSANWVAATPSTQAARTEQRGFTSRLNEPRIKPLEEPEWSEVERELLAPIKAERGFVPTVYKTLARHPRLFAQYLSFDRYIRRGSSLPPREREILICRIAWLSRCGYEWSAHTTIGLENGLTRQDLARVKKGPGARGWSVSDQSLVRAVDELYADVFISDATWTSLAERYQPHQMMDLVITVGGYHMLAMALNSFGVQVDDGAAGFSDWSDKSSPKRRVRGGTRLRLREPRIRPVSEAAWTPEQRELLAPLKQQRGSVLNVFATLARHPALYRPWLAFARHILRDSTLPAREREMLICRIAWLTGAEYEWSHHARLGKDAGLTDAEIMRLADQKRTAPWVGVDAAVVGAVDELHRQAFISNATWKTLAGRFDTRQLIDLVFTVGSYKMLGMALNSFGTQLDPGAVGFPHQPRPGKDRLKVLGQYTNRRQVLLKYLLIPKNLATKSLITLATKLHRAEPKTYFWFLDDDAKFVELLRSLKEIEEGNSDNFPADWARDHIVANLQEWIAPGRRRYWVLCKGDGSDKIAEIR